MVMTMNEQKILFQASWMNWGELCRDIDPLISKNWTVFFDGTVGASAEYAMSGETAFNNIALPPNEFEELRKLLDHQFTHYHAIPDGADGEGWEMCLFDINGKVIHQISGYIYGIEYLETIANFFTGLNFGFTSYGSGNPFQ